MLFMRLKKMNFSEKLMVHRKTRGWSQEELAERLNVSRQAVAKWESGFGFPDIGNLISISNILNVTLDYLVKEQECSVSPVAREETEIDALIRFRLEANVNTYAAFANEVEGTRGDSHDFHYENGDWAYHDTYVGGEQFAGEEAVWKNGKAIYAMNYLGRVLDQKFSGNFLKEALRAADEKHPFRGPDLYQNGEYCYKSNVTGDVNWYTGYEEIYCNDEKVYECYFHGGLMK